MFVLIGFVVVAGSILGGYLMHGGKLMVLMQVSEFIIIGGSAIGSLMIASTPASLKALVRDTLGLFRPNPFSKQAYRDLLAVLYELFYAARREGLIGIEEHAENPGQSTIFKRYPSFTKNHHAVDFLTDTLKVLLSGTVPEHNLAEILELDLERHHETVRASPKTLATVGDALPGFGIVAAVLGVIITMGYIGGSPEQIGKSVGAALVGTFLGVLGAYGVVHPMASALENRGKDEHAYMDCIRVAILSFARGDAPLTSVEFARRAIMGDNRPSFGELETLTEKATEKAKAA